MGSWSDHRVRKQERRASKRRARRHVAPGRSTAIERLGWRLADATDLPWVRGIFVGLVVWLFCVGLSSFDYLAYHDEPLEDAEVVAIETSATVRTSCGRLPLNDTPAQITTFRVQAPRQGLPDEFTWQTCPGDPESVGDVIRVRRTGVGPEHVYPYPFENLVQLWTWPWYIAALAGAAATVAFWAREEWQATLWHQRSTRSNELEAKTVEAALRRYEARQAASPTDTHVQRRLGR